jgi:predicted Zn-dependent peptidase
MKPKIKTLKNGLRIVTLAMPENPTVTVLTMVEAGTRFETRDTNGLSHFLEHMCFKGTQKRGNREIAYELEAMGAETNAFTWYDYTGYYAKARAKLFPRLLDVVSDVYLNSTFPTTEIEKERGVICGEIDMYEDMPPRRVGELFNESLFGDQPLGYTVLGPKENIKKFTQADFKKYRDAHYIAEKTVIVVVGNINESEVVKQVSEAFKTIKAGKIISKKKVTTTSGDNILVKEKKTDQSHIVVGLRTVPLGHPDSDAINVMTGILGSGMSSRLFLKLREEMGAGYYVRAGQSSSDDIGDFSISTGTEPKRAMEIISAIMSEIKKIKTERVGDAELAKVKEYMTGGIYMGNESTDAIAYHLGSEAILHQPLKMPRDIEHDIRAVTADDVLRVAKKYLKPEKFHLAIIGPHGGQDFSDVLK